MKFDFHQSYCPTNMFDKHMLDSLAKASTKSHKEKRRSYSAAQSHIVNYSRDLIFVDKMAELDEVVENPIKQPIKPSPPIFVHFFQICGSIAFKICSNFSRPISIISLNQRVSCIFSSFIVINIPRSSASLSILVPFLAQNSYDRPKDLKLKLRVSREIAHFQNMLDPTAKRTDQNSDKPKLNLERVSNEPFSFVGKNKL